MEPLPTIALVYDFDGTLSPGNMQEYGFIPATGLTAEEFWRKSKEMKSSQDASEILCYMRLMVKEAQYKDLSLKRESLQQYGKEVALFDGVKEWFCLIAEYGREQGFEVKHYINSSGLKEIIEGTSIAEEFEEIYACSFLYSPEGAAIWPGVAVDFTTKTQFLYMINKGISRVKDNAEINKFTPEEKRPVPFTRMIYFGDGATDIPCMKMVKFYGGHSIAVYAPAADKTKIADAENLIAEERVNFVCPADYSADGEIHEVVKAIIDKIKGDYKVQQLLANHQKRVPSFPREE